MVKYDVCDYASVDEGQVTINQDVENYRITLKEVNVALIIDF